MLYNIRTTLNTTHMKLNTIVQHSLRGVLSNRTTLNMTHIKSNTTVQYYFRDVFSSRILQYIHFLSYYIQH